MATLSYDKFRELNIKHQNEMPSYNQDCDFEAMCELRYKHFLKGNVEKWLKDLLQEQELQEKKNTSSEVANQSESEQIEQLTVLLKSIKSCIKKKQRLSDKAFNMNFKDHTPKQISKANTDLDWACMEYEKAKTDFARAFKNSCLDVSTEEKEYRPSGFHTFKG